MGSCRMDVSSMQCNTVSLPASGLISMKLIELPVVGFLSRNTGCSSSFQSLPCQSFLPVSVPKFLGLLRSFLSPFYWHIVAEGELIPTGIYRPGGLQKWAQPPVESETYPSNQKNESAVNDDPTKSGLRPETTKSWDVLILNGWMELSMASSVIALTRDS